MFLDIVGGHYNIQIKHFDDFLRGVGAPQPHVKQG